MHSQRLCAVVVPQHDQGYCSIHSKLVILLLACTDQPLLCLTVPAVYVGSLKIMLGTGSLSGFGLDHSSLAARQVGCASTIASVLLWLLRSLYLI